jgi:hypothetical protein
VDTSIPYLRTQAELLTEMKVKTRLGTPARWTDPEYLHALNEVVYTWSDHVKLPRLYTLPEGWRPSQYEYALPSYIRPPLIPQLLRRRPYTDYAVEATTASWQDLPGWETEGNATGGLTLRPHAPPHGLQGRVLYYTPNSRVPLTVPVTSSTVNPTDTIVSLTGAVDVSDCGHIKIEAEYMSYAGVLRDAATTTLTNIVHGLYGSTAATHLPGVQVQWVIAMDTMSLQALLFNQWRAYMAAYFLQDGGSHELSRFEKSLGYYDSLAANYFMTYKSQRRRPGLTLNSKTYALR